MGARILRFVRRGRGRSRSKGAPADDAPEEAADQEESQPSRAADEDDDDNLSNWTVPSWQELIASLYRPER